MKKLSFISVLSLIVSLHLLSCNDVPPTKATEPRQTVTYPEKKEMYLMTDRPPQLETPLKIFRQDITPNEYFFVRWHMSQIVTRIDIDTFRLYVEGAVQKPLALSMNDLKTKFVADSIVALAICAGNSRSTFTPRVPGTQWANGSMGNAKWKGVKLKDILKMAGANEKAVDVSFQGLDKPPLPSMPAFIKSLSMSHAMEDEILVAYEMNGQPLPMLNGYPLKLIVPGWYATYWIGALSNINVMVDSFHGFWMAKAYQIPKEPGMNESPDNLAKATVPINKIMMHSIFVEPEVDAPLTANKPCQIEGLAFTDGTAIKKIELSTDDGKTWIETKLDAEIGKYSWRRWRYNWTPTAKGTYHLKVKATDVAGNTQPEKQWNRSGYGRGFIECIDVNVN